MPEAGIAALLLACPLIGAISHRWLTLLLPAIGWPVFYLGLQQEWWGHGVGDGWEYAAVLLTLIGLLSTGAAIAAGRAFFVRWRKAV